MIYLFCIAWMAFFKTDMAFTKIFSKYLHYANVFLANLLIKLPEYNSINNHIIKLEKGKQRSHRPIYSLVPIE